MKTDVQRSDRFLCNCCIKRKFQRKMNRLKNHASNDLTDMDYQYISLVWTKIWEKFLFEILPPEDEGFMKAFFSHF